MNPVKTLCFTFSLVALLAASVAAQTLYFYPPDESKWIAGRSYIHNGSQAAALEIEPTKCGWYKVSIPAASPLRNFAQFWLGRIGSDKIGPNGRMATDFDEGEDFSSVGGVFRLGEIFNRLGNNIYFVADELDPTDPTAGWYGTDPGIEDPTRCKWSLAAFIYDTDPSVHPDFSCGSWVNGLDEGNGASTKATCEEGPQAYSGAGGNKKPNCTGVVKGLVAPTLGEDRKIRCGDCMKNGCWSSAEWFNSAFNSTTKVNVQRCYDMPFTQVKTGKAVGSFEFDSDKMTQTANTSRPIGGFFPELLNSRGTDDYSQCPTCDTKRSADRFPPRVKALTKEIFDDYDSKPGDFKDGDTPKLGAFGLTPASDVIYDWAARTDANTTNTNWGPWYLHGSTALKNTYGADKTGYDAGARANQHFCFESHADFYYDPAQEFYFSGDDPIWVYIDRKLVIDLGGAHMAAPGHIKLNTLGLTEGNLYPIDIFFCDQRTVNSNVRITTNMYVVQKSSFYNIPERPDNTMCAAITGGSDCASKMSGSTNVDACGPKLIDGGYKVDFYMVRRGTTDTTWLSGTKNTKECSGNDVTFTCFGGIKVDKAIYSCGNRGQCKGNPDATRLVNVSGNFNVYARLVGPDGKQVPGSKPLLIDNFKSETNTRIVWGKLVSINGEKPPVILPGAYGDQSTREQSIVAGKRTPIYISTGSWDDPNTFGYDDESETANPYSLSISGGTGLRIYKNENDVTPHNGSGNLPPSGIDTLWVEAGYDIGNKDFFLNVTTEREDAPSMKLSVRQPELRFSATQKGPQVGSGWQNWAVAGNPPYVRSALDINVEAWDPIKQQICTTCNSANQTSPFVLRERSSTDGTCNVKPGSIVVSTERKMESGKATVSVRGQESTESEGSNNCTAKWTIYGPTEETTTVTWTGLKFKEAPVPIPNKSLIFDRNGDGIGDSVYIEFSKSFGDTLLPVLLAVFWADDTIYYHADYSGYKPADFKDPRTVENIFRDAGFRAANKAYWQKYVKTDGTLSIGEDVRERYFSKGIKTTGIGKISSYIPFINLENKGTFTYEPMSDDLLDRISPIVVKAEYDAGEVGACDAGPPGCRERLVVTLSEAVFAAEGSGVYDWKNPFDYCFRSQDEKCGSKEEALWYSQGWDNLDWAWEHPQAKFDRDTSYSAGYRPGTSKDNEMAMPGSDKRDSLVQMVYYRYKTPEGVDSKTRKPKAGDWVKIRRPVGLANVFVDASGNPANLRERGVLISGTNASSRKQLKVATIKGPNPPILGNIVNDPNIGPWWWDNRDDIRQAIGGLFTGENVAAILPIVATHPDSVKQYYPGSVGAIFEVESKYADMEAVAMSADCQSESGTSRCTLMDGTTPLMGNIAKAISLHASAYYHTNIGDYTAHKENIVVQCTDKVFASMTADNCADNKFNFYLAWDLKANSGRFVGAGAYVGISKFYMQLNYKRDGNPVTQKFEQQEFIEMYGVRRNKP